MPQTFQEFISKRKADGFQHMSTSDFLLLLHNIERNDISEFDRLWFMLYGHMGYSLRSPIEQIRTDIIALAAYACFLAILDGASADNAFNIADYYIYLAYEAISVDDIRSVFQKELLHFGNLISTVRRSSSTQRAVNQIMEYISLNLYSPIRISDIAASLGLTPAYVSSLFHRETGIHLKKYIHYEKIREAHRIMAFSSHSLTEIAQILGYSDLSHFSKVCKEYTGVSPSMLTSAIVISLPNTIGHLQESALTTSADDIYTISERLNNAIHALHIRQP